MVGAGREPLPVNSVFVELGGHSYRVDAAGPIPVAIPIDFHGDQPSHFGAPRASASALQADGFTGDTREGGSCNCETLSLTPHCNGTHTECVGHITGDRVSVDTLGLEPLIGAALVSVEPEPASDCGESADPAPLDGDRLITASGLGLALQRVTGTPVDALLIRTLPNDPEKLSRDYSKPPIPPFLSREAMSLLVSWDIKHLLTDLPSIDRGHDQGRLSGHRLFWDVAPGETDVTRAGRPEATITELIYVPNETPDGLYALSLQIAPFVTDAAPSRPILYPLETA